ncbi:hypothetical protein M5D96_011875 [Drosophila gunungcola]|uniref:Uncharacterized protein n=1 Tax=Drosophila gunungcola TaxID=103775 RepID=A0A9Q0BK03_9MUSC|nr:hypothetical protein M5D96_011875 [Drosophila gunungcola]
MNPYNFGQPHYPAYPQYLHLQGEDSDKEIKAGGAAAHVRPYVRRRKPRRGAHWRLR